MWPFEADSRKRLRAAAAVLSWRLDEVRAAWRLACRGGRLDISRALCAVERTLNELSETDFGDVPLARSDRLFDLIERANRIIDRAEARISASLRGDADSGSGADALFLKAS
jgi:hypothetical protein